MSDSGHQLFFKTGTVVQNVEKLFYTSFALGAVYVCLALTQVIWMKSGKKEKNKNKETHQCLVVLQH